MSLLIGAAFSHMISLLIIFFVLAIVTIILGLKIKRVDPNGKTPLWLTPIIALVEIINNFTKTNIGKRWKVYAPYFLTIAIYIFIQNTCSIFGLTNPTSYLMTNLALGIITFFIIQITGIVSLGIKGYLKSFVGPVKWLCFLMIPMNIVSELVLPCSLALRLTGNMISGNVISIFIKGLLPWPSSLVLSLIMPFINAYFDIISGVIQTFVFVMLTIIFTSMKIDDSEKIYE